MFIFGDILITVAKGLHFVLGLYQFIIIAAVVMTWLQPRLANETAIKLTGLLQKLTNPVFNWLRQWIAKKFGHAPIISGFDMTPAILWFVLFIADSLFYMILMHIGLRMSMGFMQPDML